MHLQCQKNVTGAAFEVTETAADGAEWLADKAAIYNKKWNVIGGDWFGSSEDQINDEINSSNLYLNPMVGNVEQINENTTSTSNNTLIEQRINELEKLNDPHGNEPWVLE